MNIFYYFRTLDRIGLEEHFDTDPTSSTGRFFCAEHTMDKRMRKHILCITKKKHEKEAKYIAVQRRERETDSIKIIIRVRQVEYHSSIVDQSKNYRLM